jgi:hypothetical protein
MTYPWGPEPQPPSVADTAMAETNRRQVIRLHCLHMAVHLATSNGGTATAEATDGSPLLTVTASNDPEAVAKGARIFIDLVEGDDRPEAMPTAHRVALEEIATLVEAPQFTSDDYAHIRNLARAALGRGR